MAERDVFERRFAAAVDAYLEGAPTEVDAARLTRALAAGVPRPRRIATRPFWRAPRLGLAWALVLLALVAAMMAGLTAAGAFRDVHLFNLLPNPTQATPPASPLSSPSPAPAPSASTAASPNPGASGAASPTAPGASPSKGSGYDATLAWTGFQRLPRLQPGHALSDPIMGDVVAGGPGFVAVGSDWVDADGAVAVAWTSPDGLRWQEHQIGIPGPTSALATPALTSIASEDGVLVAVGRVGIWRSTDGTAWEQAAAPHDLDGSPSHVAAGPGGFVVVGRAIGDPCQGRAWVSPDGRAWQASALPGAARLCPTAVAGSPAGFVVTGEDPGSGRTAIAASPDGATWEPATSEQGFEGDGHPESVLWAAGRWTAFGSFQPAGSTTRGIQVWQSADGIAWVRAGFNRPPAAFSCDEGSVHMLDAVALGPGYVAVGTCVAQPEEVGVAWTSGDGATWESVLGRVRPMTAIASDGVRLVTVGSDWPGHEPIAASATVGP